MTFPQNLPSMVDISSTATGAFSSAAQLFIQNKNKAICWVILHRECGLLVFHWADFWNQKCMAVSAIIIDCVYGIGDR